MLYIKWMKRGGKRISMISASNSGIGLHWTVPRNSPPLDARIWNTRRNHFGWRLYLRGQAKDKVSPYAAPIHQTDYHDLPPCYTFVGEGEPFYAETLQYVKNLLAAGVPAEVDVYPTDMHAFDMLRPQDAVSKEAIQNFERHFEHALRMKL